MPSKRVTIEAADNGFVIEKSETTSDGRFSSSRSVSESKDGAMSTAGGFLAATPAQRSGKAKSKSKSKSRPALPFTEI